MTINISLPRTMLADIHKIVKTRKYASISEFVRDALRRLLYEDSSGKLRKFVDNPTLFGRHKKVYLKYV